MMQLISDEANQKGSIVRSCPYFLALTDEIIAGVLVNLKKRGKGILLMHDFQHATAVALPQLLEQLRINGYRIVHLQPKEPVRTLADYDALVSRQLKGSVADARPPANVVRTITRRAD
ncbi:MAG: hypothetical protein WAM17_14455 [Rhodoplanes sp.]